MSNSSSDDVVLITAKYILRPISAVGIFCNVINILVLTDKRLKESPYSYLIGLAFSDLVVSILTFTHSIITDVTPKYSYHSVFWNVYIFYPCINIAIKSSVWTTLALSIERVVFVSRPLQAKLFCRRNIARSVVVSILLAAIIENIPRALRMTVGTSTDCFQANKTQFGQSRGYVAYEWADSIITQFIPLALLCSFNTYLIVSLRMSYRQQASLGVQRSRHRSRLVYDQNRLTLTLITIICMFLLFITPSAFVKEQIAISLFSSSPSVNQTTFINSDFYRGMRTLSNTLVTTNSALNFFVYCLLNRKFFTAFRLLILRPLGRRPTDQQQQQQQQLLLTFANSPSTQTQNSLSCGNTVRTQFVTSIQL